MSKQKKTAPQTAVNLPVEMNGGGISSLAPAEERFLRLAESLAAYIFILDLRQFKSIYFNRSEFLGYSREELLASAAVFRVVHPDDKEKVAAFSQSLNALPVGEEALLEYRLQNKAGEWEWIRHKALGLSYDVDGRPTQLLILLDVFTEQWEEERALRRSERQFRILAENLPGVVYLCDNDEWYTMRYISAGVTDLLGYEQALFQNNELSFTQLYHPDDVAAIDVEVTAALDAQRSFNLRYRLKHKDGRYIWIEEIGAGVYSKDGELLYLEGFLQDITERVEAESQVLRSEEQFRILAENLPGVVYLCHNDERYSMIFISLRVAELTGYPHALFQNNELSFTELYHPDDVAAIDVEVTAALDDQRPFQLRYRLKHKEGHYIWIEEVGSGIFDETDELLYLEGFLQDVTERIALETEIGAALERRRLQVALSTQIAQEIIATTDLNQLYRDVVKLVKEQFGYYHAQILRYEPTADAVVLITGYGEVGERMLAAGHKMPMGVGVVGTAAATGHSVLSADVREDPAWRPNPMLPDTQGELAVPIKFGEELLGVLDVQSDMVGSLNEEDIALLEGLCGQIAIAIESARLRQGMSQQLDELNRLQRFLSEEGWRAYQSTADEERFGYMFDQTAVTPLSTDLLIDWLAADRADAELAVNNQPTPHLTPLVVRGAPIGFMGLENEPSRPLTNEDEALIESIATQVSEALETVRLLEQTQKRAVELETVARTSAIASTILDRDKLLKTVVDLTKTQFNLYNVSIFILDETGTGLRLAAASGEEWDDLLAQEVLIPIDQQNSLIARAAREKQPVIVNDVGQEPQFMAHPLLPNTRAELALPMLVGDRLLGLMDVQSEKANRFLPDDVRIQTTLATQVAIALQNANLYAEQLATAAKLREVDRLKSEFLASMSHELRTPLNSIIGFADVMLEGIDGPLNERMVEDVTFIRDSGRHLRELIGEILDMSKIEAGMMELRYNKVDPKRLARDVMIAASGLRQNKEVELRVDVDPETEIIQADEMRLRQILYNLMSNAVKFTEQGHVTLSMKTTEEALVVSVEDTGIGIHPEDIPIVFEQFRQVDGSLARKVGGTGLGMPISKSLVELHRGQMGVDSVPGKGSIFWFTIPKTEPTAAAKSDTGPLRPGTGPLRLGRPK